MKRCIAVLLAVLMMATTGPMAAQTAPEFKLGFAALAEQIRDVSGTPLENEHWGPNGDSLQRTTTGLMVWRKADNWTAFTNGSVTWINGPNGVEARANEERFPWESQVPTSSPVRTSAPAPAPAPAAPPAPTRAPTPTPAPLPFTAWEPGPGSVTGSPIQGVIDGPTSGQTLEGTFAVGGWALDPRAGGQDWNGIDEFRVFLDGPEYSGRRVDTKQEHGTRQDVANALGKAEYAKSGFVLAVDRSAMADGQHTLFVYAHSKVSGWWYKRIPITIARPAVTTITMDGKQYLVNDRWARLFGDNYLRGALAYAYNYGVNWRRIADTAGQRQTKVQWGTLPADVGGMYSPRDNLITINSSLKTERTEIVAAVLAHETYHAMRGNVVGSFDCFQDEIDAFEWEAYVFGTMPTYRLSTRMDYNQLALLGAWLEGDIKDYVVTSAGYQQQCLGGVLR